MPSITSSSKIDFILKFHLQVKPAFDVTTATMEFKNLYYAYIAYSHNPTKLNQQSKFIETSGDSDITKIERSVWSSSFIWFYTSLIRNISFRQGNCVSSIYRVQQISVKRLGITEEKFINCKPMVASLFNAHACTIESGLFCKNDRQWRFYFYEEFY